MQGAHRTKGSHDNHKNGAMKFHSMSIRIHHITFPILVSCYFLAGMQTTQGISYVPGQHNLRSHSTSKDTGNKSQTDNRPYWTSHKHKPETNRPGVQTAAIFPNVPSNEIEGTEPASVPVSQSVLSVLIIDLRTGRSPPIQSILI